MKKNWLAALAFTAAAVQAAPPVVGTYILAERGVEVVEQPTANAVEAA